MVNVRSEDVADGAQNNWLVSAARRVAPWARPAVGALHELVVQSPDGRSRTFRSARIVNLTVTLTLNLNLTLTQKLTLDLLPSKPTLAPVGT